MKLWTDSELQNLPDGKKVVRLRCCDCHRAIAAGILCDSCNTRRQIAAGLLVVVGEDG